MRGLSVVRIGAARRLARFIRRAQPVTMQLLYKLLYRVAPTPSDEAILNKGLSYSMVWGKSWLTPIQTRMRRRYRKRPVCTVLHQF